MLTTIKLAGLHPHSLDMPLLHGAHLADVEAAQVELLERNVPRDAPGDGLCIEPCSAGAWIQRWLRGYARPLQEPAPGQN